MALSKFSFYTSVFYGFYHSWAGPLSQSVLKKNYHRLFWCLFQAVLPTLFSLSFFIIKLGEFKQDAMWRALGIQGPCGTPNISHLWTYTYYYFQKGLQESKTETQRLQEQEEVSEKNGES